MSTRIPTLLVTDDCFSGEVPFEVIKSELGNVAPEYTGPLYPEARTCSQEQILPAIVNDGASVEDALARGPVPDRGAGLTRQL